jgi:hypothetical protein
MLTTSIGLRAWPHGPEVPASLAAWQKSIETWRGALGSAPPSPRSAGAGMRPVAMGKLMGRWWDIPWLRYVKVCFFGEKKANIWHTSFGNDGETYLFTLTYLNIPWLATLECCRARKYGAGNPSGVLFFSYSSEIFIFWLLETHWSFFFE